MDKPRTYKVMLSGNSPLLLHADDPTWSESIDKWRRQAPKDISVPGDDRSPPWTWIGSCYTDGKQIVMAADCLMAVLREGGKKCPVKRGKGSYQRQTQSGIIVNEVGWPLLNADNNIFPWEEIKKLIGVQSFEKQEECARSLGFELFCKRAAIGTKKHLRVRPRFNKWSCSGTITVFDESLTEEIINEILTASGRFAGLGDWRPGSPKSPGPWGTFSHKLEEIK
jgi:hypothetical protein